MKAFGGAKHKIMSVRVKLFIFSNFIGLKCNLTEVRRMGPTRPLQIRPQQGTIIEEILSTWSGEKYVNSWIQIL